MEMKELLSFIAKVDEQLLREHARDAKTNSLLGSIKLSEEVGEFNEQLLGHR